MHIAANLRRYSAMFNDLSRDELGRKLEKFGKAFDPEKLFSKLLNAAGPIGKEMVRKILQLYYVLQNPEVPAKSKALIICALGYVISPFDFIPDLIPAVGFIDDIAAVTAVFATVSVYIDDKVNAQVEAKMSQWFSWGQAEKAEEQPADSGAEQETGTEDTQDGSGEA